MRDRVKALIDAIQDEADAIDDLIDVVQEQREALKGDGVEVLQDLMREQRENQKPIPRFAGSAIFLGIGVAVLLILLCS